MLAVSGVYLAYRQTGELGALPHTLFGRLLLVKTAVALGILALAYYSRRAVMRGTGPRATVAGETILGVATLAVTAVLVNAEPARVAYVDPIDTTLNASGGMAVELKVNPAKQGENVTDVYLMRRNGALQQVPELTARLLPEGGGSGALDVAFRMAEPGHFVASPMTVPYPGDWTLRLQIRTTEFDDRARGAGQDPLTFASESSEESLAWARPPYSQCLVKAVRAVMVVESPGIEVEQLWHDRSRWASWMDGFTHLEKLEGEWPLEGARRVYSSLHAHSCPSASSSTRPAPG